MLSIDWENNSLLYHWHESKKLKNAIETNKFCMCYTMPGLKTDEQLTTTPNADLNKLFTDHFSKISPELNSEGLSKLMKQGYLELALNATTVLLSQLGQGLNKIGRNSTNNETTLQLWALRFQIMFMLKMTQQVIEEMNAFEDLEAPDLYFQYYPNSNRRGTMVPFSLRLMHAEVLRFTPFPWKAIHRIMKLKSDVEWVINDLVKQGAPDDVISNWRSRYVAVEKEYGQSMENLEQTKHVANPTEKEQLCLEMMRMALTSGDETTANAQLFEAASQPNVSQNDILIHKALRAIFLGAFSHASEYIQRLLKAGVDNSIVANLSAICLLYTGKVIPGVEVLSKCNKPLPDYLMTNIRAMSELGLPAAQKDTLLFEIGNQV